MTKFHDIPFFFLLTLENNHPNNINTGKGISKMNFSRMKMLKLTRRGAGFTGISTFSCVRKFIFSHMKMFGGGALLQNEEF